MNEENKEKEQSKVEEGVQGSQATPDSGKTKVLLADDDLFLLEMYAKKFVEAGFDVKTCPGPDECMEALKGDYLPDIMVFDVVMPGMTGIEMAREIKNQNLAPETVMIVLSNEDRQEFDGDMKELGIHGYIVKAVTVPSEIVTEVQNIYQSHKQ